MLEIIANNEPINYTDLHSKLIEETKIKISKHTLNKCINYLLFMQQIIKEHGKGQGNPVYFKMNEYPYKFVIDLKLRRKSLLDKFNRGDKKSFEHAQFVGLDIFIGQLNQSLIKAMAKYSKSNKINAANDKYKEYLETQFFPSLIKILELVKPPLEMSEETFIKLINVFDPANHALWIEGHSHRPGIPFNFLSEEESEAKIQKLNKWMEENGIRED